MVARSGEGTREGTRGVSTRWVVVGVAVIALVAAWPTRALAIRFGPDDSVEVRAHVYSQATVSTEYSQQYTQPPIDPGNLKQWRNFYNPELEVDFRKLTGWRSFFSDFSGRVAIWGFYDGIYDFGPARYASNLLKTKDPGVEAAFYSQGYSVSDALSNTGARRDGREFYGRRTRVNEAYVNFAKGPFFLRVGRQAISWGEADTIGLLDANNPFDVLLTPGVQIDLDEARIPLWTVRSTYELFDKVGALSSGFLDAYWVPGWIDTNTGYLNIQGVSPYSQPPPLQGPVIQVYDKLPRYEGGNSRLGLKFQTVVNRDYNLSTWVYRSFQLVPVPTLAGFSAGNKYITTITHHGLENVVGTSLSFYSDVVSSVVRSELELFLDEQAFLAYKGIGSAIASSFTQPGKVSSANLLRGEFGLDHNFFIPEINPASSFLAILSFVMTANLSETGNRTYRTPIIKTSAIEREQAGGAQAGSVAPPWCDNPSAPGPKECDFVKQQVFEGFFQATVRSDFAGGTVEPQLTTIATLEGALLFAPEVNYRWSDSLLFDVKYINAHTFGTGNNGYTPGVGLLRDRDQVWFRATYQLN
jgi:hypothetical protein